MTIICTNCPSIRFCSRNDCNKMFHLVEKSSPKVLFRDCPSSYHTNRSTVKLSETPQIHHHTIADEPLNFLVSALLALAKCTIFQQQPTAHIVGRRIVSPYKVVAQACSKETRYVLNSEHPSIPTSLVSLCHASRPLLSEVPSESVAQTYVKLHPCRAIIVQHDTFERITPASAQEQSQLKAAFQSKPNTN
ncbi:hypothetical protein HBH99_068880 [Parastagonospora nodorum]|nr:hypothetical protein HBI10_091180 [Parastagonospora nodorum]KAH4027510.1 hypothetical protein HBI13_060200 [Parastagonospora nodorum]KAH4414785.1 hypothetical protein HBH99_068880 [Parastagonospora nodorum]KAH4588248.1 hypothetical protein HBH83_122800 [Parastagonospora nodorum]KAH4667058.1 hypothetical protein HBH80_105290 [Parastagonospora nodorum]